MNKILVCITGPTASGKTALSVQLALHFKTEIVSFDSRQFYKELTIGSAPPTEEQLQQVPHHFIFCRSVTQPYNAATYAVDAEKLINDLFTHHDIVIMVGGSGLYLNALMDGLDDMPEVLPQVREELQQTLLHHGIKPLQKELQQLDSEYFSQVDIHNPARLIRALEIIRSSGKKYSELRKQHLKKNHPFQTIIIFLNPPRSKLYAQINERVDKMLVQGLLDEACSLIPYRNYKPLDTVGYKELFNYFDGNYSLPEAIEKIKQHTRNYAKRQITWFKKSAYSLEISDPDSQTIIQYIEQSIC